jgi:hypothetical protein
MTKKIHSDMQLESLLRRYQGGCLLGGSDVDEVDFDSIDENQTYRIKSPYYDAIFHQIINDYNHYNPFSGNTSFSGFTNTGGIVGRKRAQSNNINYWTQYVDNSKYPDKVETYTTLPCDGDNEFIGKNEISNI